MRTLTAIFILITLSLAEDPQILNLTVEEQNFAAVSFIDTTYEGSDTLITIKWAGSITFSVTDTDTGDSMGVFIDIVIDNDTFRVDSAWGSTTVATGNNYTTWFTFTHTHRNWSGSTSAKLRLTVDDISDHPEKVEAAKKVCSYMEHVGNDTPHIGFDRKTVRLDRLIKGLGTAEMASCLALFGGQPFFKRLKRKNRAFNNLCVEKVDYETSVELKRKSEAKQHLAYHLESLFSHLNYITGNDPDTNPLVVKKVNEIIGEVTARAQARKTRSENSVEEQVQEITEVAPSQEIAEVSPSVEAYG